MGRRTAFVVVVAVALASCSSTNEDDAVTTDSPAASTTSTQRTTTTVARTTAPASSTSTSTATSTSTSTTVEVTITAAPTSSAAPFTPPPPATTSSGVADKVVLQVAGFLVPQGEYSFEEAPEDTVASWLNLLDATATTAPVSGTVGGVDVYDAVGAAIGRTFVFVADSPLAPTTISDLHATIAPGSAPEAATVAGTPGLTWTQGAERMFLGVHVDTVVWVISGPGGVEATLTSLLESLGG